MMKFAVLAALVATVASMDAGSNSSKNEKKDAVMNNSLNLLAPQNGTTATAAPAAGAGASGVWPFGLTTFGGKFPDIMKNTVLMTTYNDDMMAYYYFWITGYNIYEKVKKAGGWSVKGSSLEKENNPMDQGMKMFGKPFKAFKAKIESELERAVETDSDSDSDDLEESSFIQKEDRKKKQVAPKSMGTVWVKWLDLCANWHITSNAYIMLNGDLKAVKTSKNYMAYFKLWRTFAMLNWMYNTIYLDYLSIWNEYKPIDWLPKYAMYQRRTMDVFVSMNMMVGMMDLYTATTTPMTTSKKALSFAGSIIGIEYMRSLKNVVLNGYISEFAPAETAKIFDINDFVVFDFAIKVLYGSGVSRAGEYLAK